MVDFCSLRAEASRKRRGFLVGWPAGVAALGDHRRARQAKMPKFSAEYGVVSCHTAHEHQPHEYTVVICSRCSRQLALRSANSIAQASVHLPGASRRPVTPRLLCCLHEQRHAPRPPASVADLEASPLPHIVFGSPPRSKTDFTGAASQRVPFPASSPHPIAPALLRLPQKYNTRSRAVMLSGVSCRWIARRLVRSRSHSCPRCTTPNVMQSLYDVFMLREFTELDICVHPLFRLPIRHDLPFVLCKRNNVMQSANAVACLTRARYHLPGRSYTL